MQLRDLTRTSRVWRFGRRSWWRSACRRGRCPHSSPEKHTDRPLLSVHKNIMRNDGSNGLKIMLFGSSIYLCNILECSECVNALWWCRGATWTEKVQMSQEQCKCSKEIDKDYEKGAADNSKWGRVKKTHLPLVSSQRLERHPARVAPDFSRVVVRSRQQEVAVGGCTRKEGNKRSLEMSEAVFRSSSVWDVVQKQIIYVGSEQQTAGSGGRALCTGTSCFSAPTLYRCYRHFLWLSDTCIGNNTTDFQWTHHIKQIL